MENNIENVLKRCAQVLVKFNYEGATGISRDYDVWGLFVPEPELDNIWIEVNPFDDTGEAYRQSDAIANYFANHYQNGYEHSTWVRATEMVSEIIGDIRKYQLDRIVWCLNHIKRELRCT